MQTQALREFGLRQAQGDPDRANVVHSGNTDMHESILEQAKLCREALDCDRTLHYAQRMDMRPIHENVAALRRHLGLKQAEFGALIDADQSYVSKWERGVVPETVYLERLADLAGVPSREFLERPWSPLAKEPDIPSTRTADQGEVVEIIQLDLSLPMGPGATVDDYVEEEPRVFDLAYIRGFTKSPPARLRLARGVGDSMWPTLQSYDQVWIDSTQSMLNQNDRVWAVSINGAAAIKRLRSLKGGRVLVISDNPGPGHENYEVEADEIRIGGRVIRFARDI